MNGGHVEYRYVRARTSSMSGYMVCPLYRTRPIALDFLTSVRAESIFRGPLSRPRLKCPAGVPVPFCSPTGPSSQGKEHEHCRSNLIQPVRSIGRSQDLSQRSRYLLEQVDTLVE